MKEVKEMKLKIEKDIREKETLKFKSLCKVIEKERATYLEELKEMKKLVKYEIESLRKLRQENDDVESEEEITEFSRLSEVLKKERKTKDLHRGNEERKSFKPKNSRGS